MKTIFKSFSLQ